MKKYDLHKIMKAAHEIYRKYFKLYQLTHGVLLIVRKNRADLLT